VAFFAVAATLTVFASGCGSGLTLVPVSGVVTMDGAPLEGATVVFSPNTPNPNGETSFAISGSDGKYEIETQGNRGAVPGKYRVSVSKTIINKSLIPAAYKEFEDDPPMLEQLFPPEIKGMRRKPNYQSPTVKIEGAFAHEVPPMGGTIDLDVKSKPASKSDKVAKKSR
jgi:hypothetical protein